MLWNGCHSGWVQRTFTSRIAVEEFMPELSRPLRRLAFRTLLIHEFERAQDFPDAWRHRLGRRGISRNDFSETIGEINKRHWTGIFIDCAGKPAGVMRLVKEKNDRCGVGSHIGWPSRPLPSRTLLSRTLRDDD